MSYCPASLASSSARLLAGAVLLAASLSAAATQGDAFNMGAVSVTVSENVGSVTLTVKREGVGGGTASVQYSTASLDATAGVDYTPVSGTLNWNDGDLTPRTVVVPILDDGVHESTEYLSVGLSNPQNGSTGVLPSEAIVILDDDAAVAAPATPIPALGTFGALLLAGALVVAAQRVRRRA